MMGKSKVLLNIIGGKGAISFIKYHQLLLLNWEYFQYSCLPGCIEHGGRENVILVPEGTQSAVEGLLVA